MRGSIGAILLVILCAAAASAARDPMDPFAYGVVLSDPGTAAVRARTDVVFAQGERGPLRMDIYYPAGHGGAPPAVIFANGVGERVPRPLRTTEIYQSWARLLAAHGIAGVLVDADSAHAGANLAQAVAHLVEHGRELGVDGTRLGVWACSANVTPALPYLMKDAPAEVRAAVLYYGAGEVTSIRDDLPVFYALAGEDDPDLIAREKSVWQAAIAAGAPWRMVLARGLPHAFDAVEPNEASRRIVGETVAFLVRQLTAPAPATSWDPPERPVLRAMYARNYPAAATGLRALLARDPSNQRAQAELPRVLLLAKDWPGAIAEYERLLDRPDLPGRTRSQALYNLACALALSGKGDQAIARLDAAIGAGFVDRRQIESDPDLESLRADARYRSIVAKLPR